MEQPIHSQNVFPHSFLSDYDIHLFKEGRHYRLYEKLGSHVTKLNNTPGTLFALWAPNAESVAVAGDFNGWNQNSHKLYLRWDSSGIFEGFIPHVGQGCKYKYIIQTRSGQIIEKCDPFAFHTETPPKTASMVWDIQHSWEEVEWDKIKAARNSTNSAISIYELHMGSWKKNNGYPLTYLEMAYELPKYLSEMGFTHVEFLPVMEHPFYGSWGYQNTGYFAPTSRYGTPQDFMYLINMLHKHNIGVYLDWVPAHFPNDEHGLASFDGTQLFEHQDKKQGFQPEWNTLLFNYSRHEIRAFLLSSAIFWLEKYKVDGLRVDAVSSMLYLDYSRKDGEWIPNIHGGKENLDALSFLRELNAVCYKEFPHIEMIAEESTAWPMVTGPTSLGGLGFGLKWDMGWMHDTLKYFSLDPVYRKYNHNNLLFNLYYFYSENFLLSLSHDEVVYGKCSLVKKMPGDDWQKFANLRLLFGYFFTHPGKKLLFMGSEFAQWNEWNHESSLDWHLINYWPHAGMQRLVRDLNRIYVHEKALFECDYFPNGFTWCVMNDSDNSVLAYMRSALDPYEKILVVCNFTPIPRDNYVVSIPCDGTWQEILNTDQGIYGGSDLWRNDTQTATPQSSQDLPFKLTLKLPPLSALAFKRFK